MKVFFLQEFRAGFSKKFIAVLLMASLFSFSFSAYHSFKYSQELSDLRELRIVEAENQLITEESNVWAYEEMGGSELVDLMQERKLCMQRILDGYNSGDMFQVLESQIKANEIQQEAKSYGLRMDSDEEKERRDQSELNKILLEKKILPYDPLIEPHDGVSSLLFLLKNIMLFLVPLVVMLIGSDSLSAEMQSGSIKLTLMFPRSRIAVLTTKYLSISILSLLTVIGSLIGAFAGGSVFSGTGNFRYPVKAQESFFIGDAEVYTSSWILLIRAMGVLICAVLFYAALALIISILVRNGIASVAVGAFSSMGIMLLNRKAVISGQGGLARYFPFDLSDSYAASLGKIVVPIQEKIASTSGLIITQDAGKAVEIFNPFPGIVPCAVLLVSALLCFFIAATIFSKRDVT